MHYINFVFKGGRDQLHSGPVPESDASYLRRAATYLKPLTDEEYMTGPGAIVNTMAKYSYVLDGDALFWCVEWDPGLLVVKISPVADMQWVALRSPVPNVGGRVPSPEDEDAVPHEDDDNPQYNLIYTPWDAQFDQQKRERGRFQPADSGIQSRVENAFARVNKLCGKMTSRFGNDIESWVKQSKHNLEKLSGKGVRLNATN